MYFNAKEYLEKGVSFYLFIGIKSIGKTYWGIHKVIDDYEKRGDGFAWIFNTQDEVKDFKTELNSYLDQEKYKIIGYNVWDIDKQIVMGKLGSINTQHKLKNLQICKTLIFDEVDNGNTQMNRRNRYAKFTKIVSNMERKGKVGFKVFCFMNAETKNNLIFDGMNVKYKGEKKKYILDGKGVIITLDKDKYFNQKEKDMSLAHVLMKQDSQIYDMAFNNEFSYDDDRMITTEEEVEPKEYLYNIIYQGLELTAFLDFDGNMIIDENHFPKKKTKIPKIALTSGDVLWNSKIPRNLDDLSDKWVMRIRKNKIQFTKYWIKELILTWLIIIGKESLKEE